MRIVRGECGCQGIALDKPTLDTDGARRALHYILVLYSCNADGNLGFEQAVRNPVEMPLLDAVALVTQIAEAAAKGQRALAALRSLESDLAWARDANQWGR